MSDYDIRIKTNRGITAEFEQQKTLTLKNQPVDKTKLTELNDLVTANGDTKQNGDVLVYNKENDNFVYTSGALIRNANSDYVIVGDAILPALGRDVDLGSRTRPFKSLFVQGNTISIGNLSLSDTGAGTLSVGEIDPASGNIIFKGTLSVVGTANLMIIGTDEGNTEFELDDGAITTFSSQTTVSTAIDQLNEGLLNVYNNTFVRNVTFTGNPLTGGVGTTVTLTISAEGTPNQYDIDWGDGEYSNGITDTTPSHVYSTNANTPFDITVTARNTGGIGAGSNSIFSRVDYVTIFAADPDPEFTIRSALVGGSTITEANTTQTVYLQNESLNIPNTDITASFSINWGDGTINNIESKVDAGGTDGARLPHTYLTSSGSGVYTVTMNVNSMSTATPGIFPITQTESFKVFDPNIAAPNNITTKTISWSTPSVGSSPALVNGFIADANAASLQVILFLHRSQDLSLERFQHLL